MPSNMFFRQRLLPCPVEVELGEYTINHSCPKILGDIFEKKPDVVGFSCYIWNMEYVKAAARGSS